MPDALLAIDQQVERRMHEVRHVRWRDDAVRRGEEVGSLVERPKESCEKVVVIPWTEEGARSDDERVWHQLENALFRLGLACSVYVERVRYVGFGVRPPGATVE